MPDRIKGFLFDLDGVIVDTARFHFVAWRSLANRLGFDFSREQNEQLKGVSRVQSLEIILSWGGIELSAEEKEMWMDRKNRHYQQLVDNLTPGDLLPGALAFMLSCKKMGYRIGLGTASKNGPRILSKLEITDLFDATVDGTMTTRTKPDPQVFLLGAEGLGLPPSVCAVFEDAAKGIQAANAGGFLSIGVGDPAVLGEADMVIPGLGSVTVDEVVETLLHSSKMKETEKKI